MALFQRKTRILLVCTENICRSPMAEGLLRHYLAYSGLDDRMEVDSAGTQASLPGSRPDQRAQKVAAMSGINLGKIRARRVTERDMSRSDMVLAMDQGNLSDLLAMCPQEHQHKISLLLSHSGAHALLEVPDPYYGSAEGFEKVFNIIEDAVRDLVPQLTGNFS